MKRLTRFGGALALASVGFAGTVRAEELGGSLSSMRHQHEIAKKLDYTFLRTPAQVREYVAKGRLEPVTGDANYELAKVSFPYARAEVRMFIERLAADYRAATGSRLVVTSLTRPEALQPRNAHELSVHPAGMAVDFRIPELETDRRWLEKALLSMERDRLLDVTRERRPPHYHVAVFPAAYRKYAARRAAEDALAAATKPASFMAAVVPVGGDGANKAAQQLAFPLNPVLGGAASGLLMFALFGVGAALLRRRDAQ